MTDIGKSCVGKELYCSSVDTKLADAPNSNNGQNIPPNPRTVSLTLNMGRKYPPNVVLCGIPNSKHGQKIPTNVVLCGRLRVTPSTVFFPNRLRQ